MSINQTPANADRRAATAMRRHWKLFVIEGIVLLILGVLAIVIPPLATLAVTIFFGWLLFLSGVIGLISTFWARQSPGFWWALLSAVLGIVAGGVLIGWPVQGMLSLTYVLIAFFLVEGVATIMFASAHRAELSGRWGFMLLSGVIDIVLAAMILLGLPSTAAWAIGILVGINMVMGGAALIAMGLHARSQAA